MLEFAETESNRSRVNPKWTGEELTAGKMVCLLASKCLFLTVPYSIFLQIMLMTLTFDQFSCLKISCPRLKICASRKYPYLPQRKIAGNPKSSMGGVWIFSGTTQLLVANIHVKVSSFMRYKACNFCWYFRKCSDKVAKSCLETSEQDQVAT